MKIRTSEQEHQNQSEANTPHGELGLASFASVPGIALPKAGGAIRGIGEKFGVETAKPEHYKGSDPFYSTTTKVWNR